MNAFERDLYEQNEREYIRDGWLDRHEQNTINLEIARRYNPNVPLVIRIKPHRFVHTDPNLQNEANNALYWYIRHNHLRPTSTQGHYYFTRHCQREFRLNVINNLEKSGWITRIARSRPFNRDAY